MKKFPNDGGNSASVAISKELFWNGYRMWNKRKKLMSKFWKDIATNEWKLYGQVKKKKKKLFDSNECTNPFHFLQKHSDLSRMRPTPCFCSKIFTKKQPLRFMDLRTLSFSQTSRSHAFRNSLHTNRDDLIRGAHDRGKIHTS